MGFFGGYFGGPVGGSLTPPPPTATTTVTAFTFNPTVASFVDEAFERCGIDPAKLQVRHLRSARRSLGLLFAEWDSKEVKLWAVDEQTQALALGDPSYVAADGTIAILEMMVRRSGIDTPVMPMSRSDYAAIPTKTSRGLPTRYYLERLAIPQYTLWQVPENSTDVLHYWRVRRMSDVGDPANTLDVTNRWFEPLVAGLASRLAVKFAPDRLQMLQGQAISAFNNANLGERERADLRISIG